MHFAPRIHFNFKILTRFYFCELDLNQTDCDHFYLKMVVEISERKAQFLCKPPFHSDSNATSVIRIGSKTVTENSLAEKFKI